LSEATPLEVMTRGAREGQGLSGKGSPVTAAGSPRAPAAGWGATPATGSGGTGAAAGCGTVTVGDEVAGLGRSGTGAWEGSAIGAEERAGDAGPPATGG